jgi:hypothetical protein
VDHHMLLAAVGVARDAVEGARQGCSCVVEPADLDRALEVLSAAAPELERHAISNSAIQAAVHAAVGGSPASDLALAEASAALGDFLRSVRIAGRPRPADVDWTFS